MMIFIRQKNAVEGGFTLVETLLVIAITAIIGMAVFNTYFNSWQSWNINRDKIIIQQTHRTIVSRLTPFVREADLVKINTAGDSLVLRFADKEATGIKYNLLEAGILNNRFYLKRGYTDGINFTWQEPTVIAGTELISIIEPLFSYQGSKKTLKVSMTLRITGEGRDNNFVDYRFSDSFFLRNEDIVINF